MNNIDNSFVDKDRPVQTKYYDLLETPDITTNDEMEQAMKKLIKKDPDFLDSYLILYEIYKKEEQFQKAQDILDKAFKRAINLIIDKKGNWPEELLWGFLGNRHIIRTLFIKAVSLWSNEDTEEALGIFRKLLKTNSNDNVGARNYLLAIRKGMTFTEYENRFNKGGYYDMESMKWFDNHAPEFPDEFGWWLDAQGE